MSRAPLAILVLQLIGAAAFGFIAARLTQSEQPEMAANSTAVAERQVDYWVAPMDPNFRSDKPGKSPMGMDLIPVYRDRDRAADGIESSLRIDPAIVNNIGVRTSVVHRTDLARRIRTVGNVMADAEQQSDVHVRNEGWIEKLAVETEGETVERGGLLFQIYAPSLVAAQSEYLQTARLGRPALVDAAAERLVALGITQDQINRLHKSGATTRLVGVFAPQSGVVTSLNVREGMFVRPTDTIMSLADLSTVWVLANIFETEVGWVEAGQAATMTVPAFPGDSWKGDVDYVYPTAQADSRTVQVRLRFPNADGRLKPNMYANVGIEAAAERDALTIPQSALIRVSTGDRVILALGNGRFRPAEVTAGIESGEDIQILAGLDAGERVVTSGQFLIDSEASLDAALLRLAPMPGDTDSEPMAPDAHGAMDMTGTGKSAEETGAASGIGRENAVDEGARE